MTHSPTESVRQFLGGLVSARQILEHPQLVPASPGIYGWWFDDTFLADQADGTLKRENRRLLYVGIAPSGPTKPGAKPRTLRDRLRNHCRGPIATSTLRRTLAALLAQSLQLHFEVLESGKAAMSGLDEEKLTDWMETHAGVMWSSVPEPWLLERELLKHGPRLPLNISGSDDRFRYVLKGLRADMTKAPETSSAPDYRVGQALDITMLGRVTRVEDHTSKEQRLINEEHARVLSELP